MALNDTEFAMITSTRLNTSLRIYIRPTLPEEFNDFHEVDELNFLRQQAQ